MQTTLGGVEPSPGPRRPCVALDHRSGRRWNGAKEVDAHGRRFEEARKGVVVEMGRIAGDGDRARAATPVESEGGEADEAGSQEGDPPGEGIAPSLLNLGLVKAQGGVRVRECADIRERTPDRLAAEAASIDAQAAARSRIGVQPLPVEADVGERRSAAHSPGTSQSSRISLVISRMSRRSSSIVARPQYQ